MKEAQYSLNIKLCGAQSWHGFFDVLLTVHLSVTSANDQLDAQFLYFIVRLLQSSTFFEQRHAHHQEVKLY